MTKYSIEKREKLANTIIFFAERIPELSKTKLIKLLYLLEEEYVKKYNIPFLDIEYEVWQAGPVNREVYIELSDEPIILNGYINREYSEDNTIITAAKAFSDDEFSDNELEMMQHILNHFGNRTAKFLVEYTHKPESAWYITAEKAGLLQLFEEKLLNSSNDKIDFERYFCIEEKASSKYQEQKEFNNFIQQFKD